MSGGRPGPLKSFVDLREALSRNPRTSDSALPATPPLPSLPASSPERRSRPDTPSPSPALAERSLRTSVQEEAGQERDLFKPFSSVRYGAPPPEAEVAPPLVEGEREELTRLRDLVKLQARELLALHSEVAKESAARRSETDAAARMAAELRVLRGNKAQSDTEMESLRRQLRDATQSVARSRSEVTRLQRRDQELTELRAQRVPVKSSRSGSGSLLSTDRVLAWIARAGWQPSGGASVIPGFQRGMRLGWTGTGPNDSALFDAALRALGVEQYDIPHESVTHVVVGQDDWSQSDLLEQVELRAGEQLRIYTQDTLLTAILTGVDPWVGWGWAPVAGSTGAHPAFQLLEDAARKPRRASTRAATAADTKTIDMVDQESLGVVESPLRLLGYRVGESSSLSRHGRQRVLMEAFEADELPFVESAEYMAKWGDPSSHQRLWRIAYHLAQLINGPSGRDRRKPHARSDWVQDLGWLKLSVYDKRRYRFPWPDVDN